MTLSHAGERFKSLGRVKFSLAACPTLAALDPDVLSTLIGQAAPFDAALEQVAAVDETIAGVVRVLTR